MEMLRSGSSGDAVTALQRKLWALGFDPGPIDGAFGPKTDDAVKRYQEEKGLQVDGIAGPETFTSLGMMEGEQVAATEVAQPVDVPDHDHHQADSPAETKAEHPASAAPSGMDALRDAEKEAEEETPKARRGFMARRAAKRARKRG